MINKDRLSELVKEYKAFFPKRFAGGERFKWEAVQCFRDNLEEHPDNFAEWFKRATAKAGSLLATGQAFPRKMILLFAEHDEVAVQKMFDVLFDESRGLVERVSFFMNEAKRLMTTIPASPKGNEWEGHFQNTNFISTYLWLHDSDKYYIYKYSVYSKVAAMLDADVTIKADGSPETMAAGFAMYDEICEVLKSDVELRAMLDAVLDDKCYNDPECKTLTIDFGFWLATEYKNIKDDAEADNSTEAVTDAPEIGTGDIHYWLYSPGNNAERWDEFYSNGIMCIGWEEIGDLRSFHDKDEVRSRMIEVYGGQGSYKNNSLTTWQFANEMKPGDVVYAKRGRYTIVGRGIVLSDYIFDETRESYMNVRKVKWTHNGQWQLQTQVAMKTLTDITQYADDVEMLEKLLSDEDEDEVQIINHPKYTPADFLNQVYMNETDYTALRELLLRKKNVILQGAPGVGKTFAAKRLAYSIMEGKDDSRIEFVQFHQSYSYEDFIMGYRPNEKSGFELREGIFYEFCQKARNDREKRKYFFIIDEINRGNLSKIFGELLMLIESDKRGSSGYSARLTYRDEQFTVPENLYIIGMMNTADRSIAIIDYALRRRFGFFDMKPAFDNDRFAEYVKALDSSMLENLIKGIKELNDEITKDPALGEGFVIGHSYFCNMGKDDCTQQRLKAIIDYDIVPMLREYWFDESKRAAEWRDKLYEAMGVNKK